MKTIINKLRYTLLAIFALTALGNSLNAATLTVCNGTTTSQYLPVYGFYYDYGFQNQMIYSASLLNDNNNGITQGAQITSITFYPQSGTGINFTGGTVVLRLGNTTVNDF